MIVNLTPFNDILEAKDDLFVVDVYGRVTNCQVDDISVTHAGKKLIGRIQALILCPETELSI